MKLKDKVQLSFGQILPFGSMDISAVLVKTEPAPGSNTEQGSCRMHWRTSQQPSAYLTNPARLCSESSPRTCIIL